MQFYFCYTIEVIEHLKLFYFLLSSTDVEIKNTKDIFLTSRNTIFDN